MILLWIYLVTILINLGQFYLIIMIEDGGFHDVREATLFELLGGLIVLIFSPITMFIFGWHILTESRVGQWRPFSAKKED